MNYFCRLNCFGCNVKSTTTEDGTSLSSNERGFVAKNRYFDLRNLELKVENKRENQHDELQESHNLVEFEGKQGEVLKSENVLLVLTDDSKLDDGGDRINSECLETRFSNENKHTVQPTQEVSFQDAKEENESVSDKSTSEHDKRITDLRDYLATLECPFTWKPDKEGAVWRNGDWIFDENERIGCDFIEHLTAKEHEFRLVKKNIFRKLCVHLVLAYEKALLGKLASAVSHIEEGQDLVKNAIDDSSELHMTIDRKSGIYHVLIATIAHIYYLLKLYGPASEAVNLHLEKYSNLSQEAKAVVHGLHSGVLMEYGYRGNRMADAPIRAAIELDPDCWLWRLFLGKILGRFRRMTEFNLPVGVEELSCFRNAANLQPEAQCLSHLADIYKQLNAVITHQDYIPEGIDKILSTNELASLPKMARDLYIKAATLEPNCPYNNARAAKGLLSLPVPFKDLDLAETYIVRALHLAPNDSMVNHYAGFYYETRREFDQALASFRKALDISGGTSSVGGSGIGNFPAELGYLSLQHRIDMGQQDRPNAQLRGNDLQGGRCTNAQRTGGMTYITHSSPLFQLDAMLSKYKSKPHKIQILCNKGYYLLKFEKDSFAALQAFAEAISIDPKSPMLKNFWSIFSNNPVMRYTSSFNIYDLVKEEIEKELQKCNSTENSCLESLLEVINEVSLRFP